MSSINRKFLFDSVRLSLFAGSLSRAQVSGIDSLLKYWESKYATQDDRWLAYIFATVHHEVDRTMRPIKERGSDRYFFEMYDIKGLRPEVAKRLGNFAEGDGIQFHGRGYVQLTGRYNYAFWQERLGIDLTSSRAAADRVLDPGIATQILFDGMVEGTFTGKKLSEYFDGVRQDWEGARRIINGTDKKALIASYAMSYYGALSYTTA
jgi:hypothetical protein